MDSYDHFISDEQKIQEVNQLLNIHKSDFLPKIKDRSNIYIKLVISSLSTLNDLINKGIQNKIKFESLLPKFIADYKKSAQHESSVFIVNTFFYKTDMLLKHYPQKIVSVHKRKRFTMKTGRRFKTRDEKREVNDMFQRDRPTVGVAKKIGGDFGFEFYDDDEEDEYDESNDENDIIGEQKRDATVYDLIIEATKTVYKLYWRFKKSLDVIEVIRMSLFRFIRKVVSTYLLINEKDTEGKQHVQKEGNLDDDLLFDFYDSIFDLKDNIENMMIKNDFQNLFQSGGDIKKYFNIKQNLIKLRRVVNMKNEMQVKKYLKDLKSITTDIILISTKIKETKENRNLHINQWFNVLKELRGIIHLFYPQEMNTTKKHKKASPIFFGVPIFGDDDSPSDADSDSEDIDDRNVGNYRELSPSTIQMLFNKFKQMKKEEEDDEEEEEEEDDDDEDDEEEERLAFKKSMRIYKRNENKKEDFETKTMVIFNIVQSFTRTMLHLRISKKFEMVVLKDSPVNDNKQALNILFNAVTYLVNNDVSSIENVKEVVIMEAIAKSLRFISEKSKNIINIESISNATNIGVSYIIEHGNFAHYLTPQQEVDLSESVADALIESLKKIETVTENVAKGFMINVKATAIFGINLTLNTLVFIHAIKEKTKNKLFQDVRDSFHYFIDKGTVFIKIVGGSQKRKIDRLMKTGRTNIKVISDNHGLWHYIISPISEFLRRDNKKMYLWNLSAAVIGNDPTLIYSIVNILGTLAHLIFRWNKKIMKTFVFMTTLIVGFTATYHQYIGNDVYGSYNKDTTTKWEMLIFTFIELSQNIIYTKLLIDTVRYFAPGDNVTMWAARTGIILIGPNLLRYISSDFLQSSLQYTIEQMDKGETDKDKNWLITLFIKKMISLDIENTSEPELESLAFFIKKSVLAASAVALINIYFRFIWNHHGAIWDVLSSNKKMSWYWKFHNNDYDDTESDDDPKETSGFFWSLMSWGSWVGTSLFESNITHSSLIQNRISPYEKIQNRISPYGKTRHLLSLFDNGDLYFFSGSDVGNSIVKILTWSKWTHVGIIIKMNNIPYVLEAVFYSDDRYIDYKTQKAKGGIRLVPLQIKLDHFAEKIGIRKISPRLSTTKINNMYKFYEKNVHKGFETDLFQLFKAAYDGPFGLNKADASSYFCSELIVDVLKNIGIGDSFDQPSNEYVPSDLTHNQLRNTEYCYLPMQLVFKK